MEAVLHGLTWKFCLVYLDDVLIFSPSFELHLKHIETVFQRLSVAGLKLRPDKCHFACRNVHYLGHVIDKTGISPDPAKIKAVSEYPTPATLKDLRAFLGLSGYYRRFIRNYTHMALPLYSLTKKGVPFRWTSQCEVVFQQSENSPNNSPSVGLSRPYTTFQGLH